MTTDKELLLRMKKGIEEQIKEFQEKYDKGDRIDKLIWSYPLHDFKITLNEIKRKLIKIEIEEPT